MDSSKMEVFETCFYDIVTTQYDHPRYVKHFLDRTYMILPYLGITSGGGGGGAPKGLVHNLLMQVFTLGCSKIELFETCFFDVVTTQNDHPRYVKHVLGRMYVFATLFGYQVRGGGGAAHPAHPQGPEAHSTKKQLACKSILGPASFVPHRQGELTGEMQYIMAPHSGRC